MSDLPRRNDNVLASMHVEYHPATGSSTNPATFQRPVEREYAPARGLQEGHFHGRVREADHSRRSATVTSDLCLPLSSVSTSRSKFVVLLVFLLNSSFIVKLHAHLSRELDLDIKLTY